MDDSWRELLYWRGKRLKLTDHFIGELYNKYKKSLDLVHEILDEGEHSHESTGKVCAVKPTKKGFWELVYVDKKNYIVLIHIKLRRGKWKRK